MTYLTTSTWYCEHFVNQPSISYARFAIFKPLYLSVFQSVAAAPFVENNIYAVETSPRRNKIDAYVILDAFEDWSNTNLEPTLDYDHGMMFTA